MGTWWNGCPSLGARAQATSALQAGCAQLLQIHAGLASAKIANFFGACR